MKFQPISNRVFVSVTHKGKHITEPPFMHRVMLHLQGDTANLSNLTNELNHIKSWVNGELNRQGLALKHYDIHIEQTGD